MIEIGAGSKIINNELGRPIQGATVDQCAKSIRDDLEANALYLKSEVEALLLVSCDLAGLLGPFVQTAREAMGEAAGVPPRNVIVAGTHMHSGPSLIPTNHRKPVDEEYTDRLQGWLVELAGESRVSAKPGRIGWGLGSTKLGYNRRCCWADGTHSMHGDTTREDFTGLEGPDDPSHVALFAQDAEGKPLAVFYNNTTHPTSFYGADFYSADFPGAARGFLRDILGPIAVVFFNGAFGDIAMPSQTSPNRKAGTREQGMLRIAHLVTGETLRLLHETEFHEDVPLAHAHEDLCMAVRLPDSGRLEWARDILARTEAGQETKRWDQLFAYGVTLLQEGFGEQPVDTIPVHAVRIGDVGLATQPCELYCQFGLDIKRRSPTPLTAVCGVADGYAGYCPTVSGILGGGYSGEPIHWCRLETEAGYRITDAAARLLHELWRP